MPEALKQQMSRSTTRLLAAALMLGLASAAVAAPATPAAEPKLPVPTDPGMFTGMLKGYKDCRAKYAEMDARIDAAGVRDGSYYRVPGFPYLRTDRYVASLKDKVSGLDEVAGWTRRMREFDQEAREFEYQNLGLSSEEIGTWRYDLLSCGSGLANLELFEEKNMAFLRKQVVPGSDYRQAPAKLTDAQRKAIAAQDAAVLKRFAAPLPAADAKAPLKLWIVKPVEDMALIAKGYGGAIPDELGVPALVDSQWRAFAERNAPALWIETAGSRDQPGMPIAQDNAVTVDPAQPRMHYQITFTRFGDVPLTQINYFIWFAGREGNEGALDSLIWRVTLDGQAEPLIYESVNASGRNHLWFAAQPLKRRPASGKDAEPAALFPQAEPIKGPVALRIAAGSHALQRVVPLATVAASGDSSAYELRRYEEVFTLATANGKTRSLYDTSGIIPGIRDTEQVPVLGDRVAAPGALHVLGRVPVAATGQTYFDDADRLNSLFVAPGKTTR
ncbi:hypothetical protein [uncultured Nevskia sp.]|uniref:hypothetical protein n=1 Tax=uncultured Nevskia sp. TaxID=228950 RepID=UPI0025DDA8A3|nr:hypothetical protein [uncultured Nevskia sp.]